MAGMINRLLGNPNIFGDRMNQRAKKKAQQRERRRRVESLRLQGWSVEQIVHELREQEQTIRNDVKFIERRWQRDGLQPFDHHKARELGRLEEVEREAWKAWNRSIGVNQKRTKSTKAKGDAATGQMSNPEVGNSTVETDSPGVPRFLQLVLSCIDRRCRLLRLSAPFEAKGALSQEERILKENIRQMNDEDLRLLAAMRKAPDETKQADESE
jgi:hypothetical protein